MRHLREMTRGKSPRVVPADILETRAYIILLTDVVNLLNAVFQLIKGLPVMGDGGPDDGGDGHDD